MPFLEVSPSREDYWRSVVLFGLNVASYKFALAKSLLEIAATERTLSGSMNSPCHFLSTLPSI